MINLRVPGEKEDSMQVQMGYVRRDGNPKKKSKENIRNKKTLEEKF